MIVSTLSSGTSAQFLLTEEAVLDRIELDMRRGANQVDVCRADRDGACAGGEFEAQLFVAMLGASSYAYVEASRGQDLRSWLASRGRALHIFRGAPTLLVPDNLKSAVLGHYYSAPWEVVGRRMDVRGPPGYYAASRNGKGGELRQLRQSEVARITIVHNQLPELSR